MSAGFDRWLEAVFAHPADGKPEWFWGPEFDEAWDSQEVTNAATVAHLTRLFTVPAVLHAYSLEQVAQGIWFLVSDSSPAQPSLSLLDPAIPVADRVGCVEAIFTFFRDFVAPSASGAADTDTDPFHIACYMWWDIFPTWGNPQAGAPELHEACLDVMSKTLYLPSELCRMSALHGLNHWFLHHDAQVVQTVDAFLAATPDLSDRVRTYAAAARAGMAL
jgi:hypothetical protein